MRAFLKTILTLFFVGAVSYGGYYAYMRWWKGDAESIKGKVEGISVRAVDESKNLAGNFADAAGGAASSYAKTLAAGTIRSVAEKLDAFAASIVGESGGENSESDSPSVGNPDDFGANQGASSLFGPIGGTFPLQTAQGSEFLAPPPFAAIVARRNVPLSFSINRAGVAYEIEWGDGERSSGLVPGESFLIIEHSWKKNGDYTMKVNIREEDVQIYFSSFPVRVYE